MLRIGTYIWLLIVCVLSYEYYALNTQAQPSLLAFLQLRGLLPRGLSLDPSPGRTLSLWLGWTGFSLMVVMNLYSVRKRFPSWTFGKLGSWLNFHILCGLIGPTLILFHCNFKVGGLVSISFWSMVVSLASGIVGRYFYVNILSDRKTSLNRAERYWQKFLARAKKAQIAEEDPALARVRVHAVKYAGGSEGNKNLILVLLETLWGDIRCLISPPPTLPQLAPETSYLLEAYAVSERRARNLDAFQRLMGYWHTFHKPFAVFMYLVAVIHIIAALFFGV